MNKYTATPEEIKKHKQRQEYRKRFREEQGMSVACYNNLVNPHRDAMRFSDRKRIKRHGETN